MRGMRYWYMDIVSFFPLPVNYLPPSSPSPLKKDQRQNLLKFTLNH